MSNVLDHSKLYEAYPEIKDLPVNYFSGKNREYGYFDPETGTIGINKDIPIAEQVDTVLHEIQHYIQKREGWSGGANPEQYHMDVLAKLSPNELDLFLNTMSQDDLIGRFMQGKLEKYIEQQKFNKYQRNQGEASARATSARKDLDDQQIRTTATTYDVPEDEISPYANGGIIDLLRSK
jgi:hypothetical protein